MSIPSMFDRSNGSVGTGGSWMGDDSIAPWLPLMGLGQGSVPHGGGPQLDPYTSPLPGGNLSLKQLVDMYGAKPSEPSPPPDNTHYQMAMFHMAKGQLLSQMQDMQSAQARGEGTGVSHEMYARLSGIDQQLQRLQGVASLQAASPPAAQNALTAGEIDRRRQGQARGGEGPNHRSEPRRRRSRHPFAVALVPAWLWATDADRTVQRRLRGLHQLRAVASSSDCTTWRV
jgi:hypothetical protein